MSEEVGPLVATVAPSAALSVPNNITPLKKPQFTNQQLIPIYTNWANRYLAKQRQPLIHDLTYDLRNPKTLISLIAAVTSGCRNSSDSVLLCSLNGQNAIESIAKSLHYLAELGVNVSNIHAEDLHSGHLGEILGLLFALSHFKQKQKSLSPQRLQKPKVSFGHATIVPIVPAINTEMTAKVETPKASTRPPAPTSRLVAPTARRPIAAAPADTVRSSRLPSAPPASNRLRAPASIRPPTQKTPTTSLVTSSCSTTSSVSGCSVSATTGGPTVSQLRFPKTALKQRSSSAKPEVPKSSPKPPTVSVSSPLQPAKSIETVNSPKPTKMFKIFSKSPKKAETVETKGKTLRIPSNAQKSPMESVLRSGRSPAAASSLSASNNPTALNEKRTSHHSDDSGCHSGSPTLSSSQSSLSASRPLVAAAAAANHPPPIPEISSNPDDAAELRKPISRLQERKPTLAVKGIAAPTAIRCRDIAKPTPAIGPNAAAAAATAAVVAPNEQTIEETERKSAAVAEDPMPSPPSLRIPGMAALRNAEAPAPSSSPPPPPPRTQPKASTKSKTKPFSVRMRPEPPDSCEDSSSISSGVSENLDDISTDDLTGSSLSDHAMAVADPFLKSLHRSKVVASSTQPERVQQRRMVEQQQNVVAELLQRSRTSQRGIAFGETPEYDRPIYQTVNERTAFLSADGNTLSASRPSARPSLHRVFPPIASNVSSMSAFHSHSLDRHGHLKAFMAPQPEMTETPIYAAASEYGSPRALYRPNVRSNVRGSQSRSSSLSSSSSLMSRSMVLYESENNLTEPNNNNNNNNHSMTPRERLYAEMMAAVSAKTPPRSRRMPLSVAASARNGSLSARTDYSSNLQIRKMTPESPQFSRPNTSHGSQLSLVSIGSAFPDDSYERLVRHLNEEMSAYRNQIAQMNTTKEDFHQIIQILDTKLETLVRHVEKLQKKSTKTADIEALVAQIEDLRQLSANINENGDNKPKDPKLNGFQRNGKKGWSQGVDSQIRNSFSRAFHKNKKQKNGGSISECEQSPLHRFTPKTSSMSTLSETNDNLTTLKKQLEEKEKQLGDIQLEALDKAREVDMLRDTVNRLKTENKALKHTTILLERRAMRNESRASSRQSLSTCCHEEETFYESPVGFVERSCSSSSSSKRSSGGLNTRVVVDVDVSGTLSFQRSTQELCIGQIGLPTASTSWMDLDSQISALFDGYLRKVDPEMKLGLTAETAIIGYSLGDGNIRDSLHNKFPLQSPFELITPTTILRLKLRGTSQDSTDSLVLESLFPREILQKLLHLLLDSRRLVINGPTGIGKSHLSRYLAKFLVARRGIAEIKDIVFPSDDNDPRFLQVQQDLEKLLLSDEESIVLIDNSPHKRVDIICSAFAAADERRGPESTSKGPFVIITLNRTSDLQLQEMQVNHNVHAFSLYCQLEPIKGYLGRYLRRRIAQEEFCGQCRCGEQLQCVIEFLSRTLHLVNEFLKDVNTLDTIGPRIFLQCPTNMDKSREWFIHLWNRNIVPYMGKVVRESDGTMDWRDPTPMVAELWPWLDGIGGESLLHSVAAELAKPNSRNSSSTSSMAAVSTIDAIYALDRLAETSSRIHQPSPLHCRT